MADRGRTTVARTVVEYARLRLREALDMWHAEPMPTRANFDRLIRRQEDLKRAIAVESPQPKERKCKH